MLAHINVIKMISSVKWTSLETIKDVLKQYCMQLQGLLRAYHLEVL